MLERHRLAHVYCFGLSTDELHLPRYNPTKLGVGAD